MDGEGVFVNNNVFSPRMKLFLGKYSARIVQGQLFIIKWFTDKSFYVRRIDREFDKSKQNSTIK